MFWLTPTTARRGKRFCSQPCYAASMVVPLVDRFWANVSKSDEPDGCWIWTGTVNGPTGYGVIGLPREGLPARDRRSRTVGAHRLSWEIHHGPIPAGLFVCHDCDRFYPVDSILYRRCVRPDHLFLGTRSENMSDMHAKGRAARGAKRSRSSLTETQVLEIRRLYAEGGFGGPALAEAFGVHFKTIYDIVRGRTWKHVH
jgi:hypothetical protein